MPAKPKQSMLDQLNYSNALRMSRGVAPADFIFGNASQNLSPQAPVMAPAQQQQQGWNPIQQLAQAFGNYGGGQAGTAQSSQQGPLQILPEWSLARQLMSGLGPGGFLQNTLGGQFLGQMGFNGMGGQAQQQPQTAPPEEPPSAQPSQLGSMGVQGSPVILRQMAFENMPPLDATGVQQNAPQLDGASLSAMLSMGGFDPMTGQSMGGGTQAAPSGMGSLNLGAMPTPPSLQPTPMSPLGQMDSCALGWAQILGSLGAGISAQDPQSWQYNLGRTTAGLAGQGLQERQAYGDQQSRMAQQSYENAMRQRQLSGVERSSELERAFEQQKYNQTLQQQQFKNILDLNEATNAIQPIGGGAWGQGGVYHAPPVDPLETLYKQAEIERLNRANQPEKPKPRYLTGVDEQDPKVRRYYEAYPGQAPQMVPGIVAPSPSGGSQPRPFKEIYKRPNGSYGSRLVNSITGDWKDISGEVPYSTGNPLNDMIMRMYLNQHPELQAQQPPQQQQPMTPEEVMKIEAQRR